MEHIEVLSAPQAATPSLVHRYQPSRPWPVAGLVVAVSAGAVCLTGALSNSLSEPEPLIPVVSQLGDDLATNGRDLMQAGHLRFGKGVVAARRAEVAGHQARLRPSQ